MPPEIAHQNEVLCRPADQYDFRPHVGLSSNDDYWAMIHRSDNNATTALEPIISALDDYTHGHPYFGDRIDDRMRLTGTDGYNPYDLSLMAKADYLTKFVVDGNKIDPKDPNWAEKVLTKGLFDQLDKDEQKQIKKELDDLLKYRMQQMLEDTHPRTLKIPDTTNLDAFLKQVADVIRTLATRRKVDDFLSPLIHRRVYRDSNPVLPDIEE